MSLDLIYKYVVNLIKAVTNRMQTGKFPSSTQNVCSEHANSPFWTSYISYSTTSEKFPWFQHNSDFWSLYIFSTCKFSFLDSMHFF